MHETSEQIFIFHGNVIALMMMTAKSISQYFRMILFKWLKMGMASDDSLKIVN